MRALILTQHFAPEVTAARFRLEAFAKALVDRGHDVDVICPVPNHPSGVVAEGYRGRPIRVRRVGGSTVTYLRVVTAKRKTKVPRAAYYGSYAAMASVVGAARRRPDVILASSPPPSVAAVGALLAARHRAPLVLDVRDLWLQAALEFGELQGGRAFRAAERVERSVYARAAHIVTANDAFRRAIETRAPEGTTVEVVPNGTSEDWLRMGEADVARSSVGLPADGFVWAYAGNIGLAHGLEFAVDAADLLGPDYRLLVIGEGPRRAALEERVAQAPADSVDLRGLMLPEDAARHLRASDALLVSERQERTISAKLYDSCALGRPVVAACRGEQRRLIEREGIGLVVEHGDAGALAAAVRRLRSEPELRERLAESGRSFARSQLRSRQSERLAEILESVAAGTGAKG